MVDVTQYLNEFKEIADEWFANAAFVEENYQFFSEFFKKENLQTAQWEDFQNMGNHIHSFNSMAIAKKNALGNPNHPIEHYRKSFIYLAHGDGKIKTRIQDMLSNENYKIKYIGRSVLSEILGYMFAEKYVLYNERDKFALDLLGIDPQFAKGDKFAEKYTKFNESIKSLINNYEQIVGSKTNVPINLEVDQFFSYLYETYNSKKLKKTSKKKSRVDARTSPVNESSEIGHYWLNASPKIWNFRDIRVGETQIYTSYNEKGNKRQKYKYFAQVQPGDIVVGYIASPDKEIVALCEITKGLHESAEGEGIEFKKIKQFQNPISLQELKVVSELEESEPLKNNQGSLFKLEKNEYNVIKGIIDQKNPVSSLSGYTPYSRKQALNELFVSESKFTEILELLQVKKNIILQGPPGCGKTYMAKRLAYTLIESKDESKIEMIQFHQSYSYEDFIQGYRPSDDGNFNLNNGIFYDFCKKAQSEPDMMFFFIIDEINRGNLSKIFGELMMLMEADKRGVEFAVPLTYRKTGDEPFFIPANLYLIGTMNTADRSLALVDYALRRRFIFVELEPGYANEKFRNHLSYVGVEQDLIDKIQHKMGQLNDTIGQDSKNLGSGYKIGHSFFCPNEKGSYGEEWYKRIVKYEIEPLLHEYWFDNKEKVETEKNHLLA